MQYVIKPGDTLSELAVRFDIPLRDLAARNKIVDINKVYAGQSIDVPSAWGSLLPGKKSPLVEWFRKLIG